MYKSKYFENEKMRKCPCGCGLDMDPTALAQFDIAREISGAPYHINSGARCAKYNAEIGGKPNSAHIRGLAFDIRFDDEVVMLKIIVGLTKAGFCRIGINIAKKFIHADCDSLLPHPAYFKY
jgi:uncharacterized protein YcbK (DUF882 family)